MMKIETSLHNMQFIKEESMSAPLEALPQGLYIPPEEPWVLLVDDEKNALMPLADMFRNRNYPVATATKAHEALDWLASYPQPGLIISDIEMPGMNGFELIRRIRDLRGKNHDRILAYTGYHGEEIEALRQGANDFVSKPGARVGIHEYPELLWMRVESNWSVLTNLREKERAMAELEVANERLRLLLATRETDSLTSFPIRQKGRPLVKRALWRERRAFLEKKEAKSAALIVLDLDRFKVINDRYGHTDGGDAVLREWGDRIRRHLRGTDIVVRYGGEEVLVLLTDCDKTAAFERAEEIRRSVSDTPFQIAGVAKIKVTVSIGIMPVDPSQPLSFDEILRRADKALYEAKNTGRNRACVYEGSG
jgi:two-component system, cell cycle response regulator